MPCMTLEGKPSDVASGLLRLLRRPGTPEKVALCFGLPLREVREDLGELAAAGLVRRLDGAYRTTDRGRALAEGAEEPDPVC